MKNIICYCSLVLLTFSACVKDDLGSTNQETFQYIWDTMDQNYGGFVPRNVDWDALYATYQPQISEQMSEAELWEVCTSMVDTLDDQHVYLYNFNTQQGFASGKIGDEELSEQEFSLATVKDNYIENVTSIPAAGEELIYGIVNNRNLGYIYIPNFDYNDSEWHKKIDDAIAYIQDTDGLILDLRNNGGGSPLLDRFMAGRFVLEEKLVFAIQTRNGIAHTDFDEPTLYYAEPAGALQFTKPTVILTNHSTVSAAEEFLLFLETQPHVTIVGDSTSNAFSTQAFAKLLPNGWEFGFPNQLYTYPDGTSPEGVGIVPDIYLRNKVMDVQNGMDAVLEKAIELF